MSRLLVSVTNLEETRIALASRVDFIDFKNPQAGALGALPIELVSAMNELVAGRQPTSATVGDLPMLPSIIYEATQAMAATDVDIVKIGFFGGSQQVDCIEALKPIAKTGTKLIAVFMADQNPDFSLLEKLEEAGFYGAMLDTADKSDQSLLDLLSLSTLEKFVSKCKHLGLVSGLAGSLRQKHIMQLKPLNADYMGFRGAVCANNQRVDSLNQEKLQELVGLLHKNNINSAECHEA